MSEPETRVNQALPQGVPPKIYTNEFNQPVREYDWTEFQKRLAQRLPYNGDVDLNGKTIVIRHCWGLGDVLYATPAIKALKEKYPGVRLIFISSFPDILKGNPAVDENYHWLQFEDFMQLSDRLKGESWYFVNYDVPLKGGFDYKLNLRTKPQLNDHLMRLLKKDPKTLSGDDLIFVNCAASQLTSRYKMVALDLYCRHLHVDPETKSVYYYPEDWELEFARNFISGIRQAGKKVITLMPHTSTMFKDYPHWKQVMKLCPVNYHWLIMEQSRRDEPWIGPNISDCRGAFNLRQSAAIIIEGDVCCSSDTGLLYTKAARGGKCVVTYGPHEPEPFLHYFPTAMGLRIPKLATTLGMEGMCSVGCYIDTTSCHGGGTYSPCLAELSPKTVADAVIKQAEG